MKSQKILILPSAPLDGDSLGSTVALYIVLKKLGKEVTAVCKDPVPETYQFLPSEKAIQNDINLNRDFIVTVDCSETELSHIEHQVQSDKVNIVLTPKKGEFSEKNLTFHHGQSKYDLIIVVDAGDLEQLGKLYDDHTEFFFTIPVINIDHHASNSEFGRLNLVDVTASSTTEILFDLIKELRPGENLIDSDVATALLAGIITDTGSFQNANTTPKSLEYASELVDLGARQQEIIKNVYKTKRLSTLKLWGKILTKMRSDEKYRFIWASLTLEDFRETKSSPEETGDIIDELMTNAPGMEIALILKEREPEFVSGSLRSTTNKVDVSKIAAAFGGGGHVRAAGFRVRGKNFETVEREIIERIRQYQSERLFFDEKETRAQMTTEMKTQLNPESQENAKIEENKEPLMVSAPEEVLELVTRAEPQLGSDKEMYVEPDRKSEPESKQPSAMQSTPTIESIHAVEPFPLTSEPPKTEIPVESEQVSTIETSAEPVQKEPIPTEEIEPRVPFKPERSEMATEFQPESEPQPQPQPQPQPRLQPEPESPSLLQQKQKIEEQPQAIDLKTSKIFGPKYEEQIFYANKLPPNLSEETKKKKMKKKEISVEDLLKKASGTEDEKTPYSFEP